MARLGRVQQQIMEVLWQRGQCTAREITDALNETKAIAHSTVQTLLRKLEAKGAVTHDVRDRTFFFRALIEAEGVRKPATREFIERMFDGSAGCLVSYLLRNERISRAELDEIQALVNAATKAKREARQ